MAHREALSANAAAVCADFYGLRVAYRRRDVLVCTRAAGFVVQEWFGLARNPYDRFGHILQGLVISMAAREVLARGGYRLGAKMLACLVCCVTLAVSAFYELIEWWVALALGKDADDFLGTQGDEWDTQADMLCALAGAFITVFALGRWHTRQLRRFVH